MQTRLEIENTLISLKPLLFKDFSVVSIGIFGSFARNEQTESSDIDLLVEFEKTIGWRSLTLEIFLEDIFKRKIDLVTKNALKESLRENILKDVKYL